MEVIASFIIIIVVVTLLILLIGWAIDDANARGRSALCVTIAVVLFFPWGWIAWLLFRPDRKIRPRQVYPSTSKKSTSLPSDVSGTPWEKKPGHR